MMESLWGTLKEEGAGPSVFRSRKEAKTAIFDDIEVFYHRKRRHSALGYLSPVAFEKQG
jgi:putative transposase